MIASLATYRRAHAYVGLAHRLREELDWLRVALGCPEDFRGMCSIASYALKVAMGRAGDRATLVFGTHAYGFAGHCWVEWRGLVLDPTHSQFGAPDVLVAPRSSAAFDDYCEDHRGPDAWGALREFDNGAPKFAREARRAADRAVGRRRRMAWEARA